MVLNGIELGGGSIRIHRRDVQQRMFNVLGIDEQAAQEKFGFLLDAFRFGAPPHGGIAFGFDRLVMLLLRLPNIREVIAYPKNQRAQAVMEGAPSAVDQTQLRDLGIGCGDLARITFDQVPAAFTAEADSPAACAAFVFLIQCGNRISLEKPAQIDAS